jgi:ubiquinone biosynthesis protein COQ9
MRFKVFFNELTQSLDINCLCGADSEVFLPENTAQHVLYPIPNELALDIREYLQGMLDQSISQEFKRIDVTIKELQQQRRQLIDEARVKMNPTIIEYCEKFKIDHPEFFI